MHFRVAIVLVSLLAGASAQQSPLRIVVLEGENAVNIIQQKTAVRAVVEVRDQNNLPVAGATVTFAVTGKGGATVAGAQTVTVTTGTSGQAALTGMTPSSSGGLQISVNAAFKGLNAATSITQSIVATAAMAAGATTAAAGAAAGGGGLSTAAIVGIVGGAVAVGGGVAVASGAVGGQRDERDVIVGPPPDCSITVTPRQILVPVTGGSFPVTITFEPANCVSQAWRVDTNLASNFVTANPTSGTGNGTTTLTIAPFSPTPTFPSRSAAIGVASTTVSLFQPTVF